MPQKKSKSRAKNVEVVEPQGPTQKEKLLALYAELKALGITRISDLENKIANCRD